MLVAKYTANASGLVPTFNNGYKYDVNETVNNGVYTVEINSTSRFYYCKFQDKTSLLTVEYLNITNSVGDMANMFRGCTNLTAVNSSNWDTSKVTAMQYMFLNCSKLTQLDVSNWDTSKVIYMSNMFQGCKCTTLDVSNWDTSSVTKMDGIFQSCSKLTQLDVSNWDTSNVTAMNNMFRECSNLTQLDVSNWDTSNVTIMTNMFYNCKKITSLDVSNWDTSKVTDMECLFAYCTNLTSLDLSNFNTSIVTNMRAIVYECNSLTSLDLSNFDISKVTKSDSMFDGCVALTFIKLLNCTESTVTFFLNKIPSRTNADKGTIMTKSITSNTTTLANRKYWELISGYLMAKYTANASGVVPTFNNGYKYDVNETVNNGVYTVVIRSLTDFSSCSFQGKSSLSAVEYLNITNRVTNMANMFSECSNLTQLDVSNWDTSNVTGMQYMFLDCANLTRLNASNWKTDKVIYMSNMFDGCANLTQLDVSNWDTSNVTKTDAMFRNCNNLTQLDVSKWNIGNVNDIQTMFYGCRSLTQLDVSNFDTSNVTNMNYLFCYCQNLTSITFGDKWNTSKVTNMGRTFYDCSNLTQLDLSNWNTSQVTDMNRMFCNCSNLTQLDLSNWNTSQVTDMSSMFESCTKLNAIGLIYANIDTLNALSLSENTTIYIDKNIDQSAYTGSSTLKIYEERSIEINIPTALRSKSGIADRLYWNDEDKHYYIEQLIDPNTEEVLGEPNVIASGIILPIELKQYQEHFSINIRNQTPSYISATVPYFDIPNDYEYDEAKEIEYFKQSFELRFPDEDDVGSDYGFAHVNEDYSMGLKRLIDWVDFSTDEEFVRDFEQYFHKQYTLRYYLLVIVLGMVDNLGKNMMLDTFDHKIWMPRFYDMDTICSYDNTGQIKFDVDIEMEQGYWNTSASRLWTRIRDLMHNDLVDVYRDMRANGMSYESFMSYFHDQQIAQIPQKYYNMDADVKYLPFADAYIGKAHGDGYEHLKRWLKKRLIFTDTLFDYQPSYINDVLTIRANTTEEMIIEIETYTPVYQHLSWYNGQMDKKKIDGKISVMFNGKAQAATDQEILIYGGTNIKSIKGISTCNPSQLLIGAATRLIELEAKDCTLLSDINSNGANLLPHTFLTKLDLSGCTALPGNLNIQNSPLLRHIDISNCTSITGINKPPTLKNIEYMKFENCTGFINLDLSNLYMPKLTSCENVFKGCCNMTNLNLSNWDIPNVANMANMFNGCNKLTSLDVSNFDTSNVMTMAGMFYNCNTLTSLDVSNFDTSNVTNMGNMFHNCNALMSLYVNGWPNNTYTQTAILSLPVGNDAKNEIYATVSFTVPSGWSLINNASMTMSLRQTDLDNLTDEEIAALVDEGWTIG